MFDGGEGRQAEDKDLLFVVESCSSLLIDCHSVVICEEVFIITRKVSKKGKTNYRKV